MVSQHDHFYMETVTFLVEDCLFKVPREPFRDSVVFAGMFSLPTGNHVAEGTSDENPVRLPGTKKDEFEQLLRVLLHRANADEGAEKLPESIEEWISVLKLSTTWGFDRVHQAAIGHLSGMTTAVDKIVLGNTYDLDVESWILPAMQELALRSEPISIEEGSRLGLEVALNLASVRELLLALREDVIRRYTYQEPNDIRIPDFRDVLRATCFPRRVSESN